MKDKQSKSRVIFFTYQIDKQNKVIICFIASLWRGIHSPTLPMRVSLEQLLVDNL